MNSPGFFHTSRQDAWWFQPAFLFVTLTLFIIYTIWAAFQGSHYTFGPYLSPLYSPEIFGSSGHSWFGPKPAWWPVWLPFSPSFLIIWIPGLFRFTCYFYRGTYYKTFWLDPPACAVSEPRMRYLGESHFPLILQNLHRYFLYIAMPVIIVLAYDAWKGLWFTHAGSQGETFGMGIGSLLLLGNVIFVTGYTFGCHALRHILGGHLDRFSGRPIRQFAHKCVSFQNRRHMLWAWLSFLCVTFSDIYIRLCSMGIWTDFRII